MSGEPIPPLSRPTPERGWFTWRGRRLPKTTRPGACRLAGRRGDVGSEATFVATLTPCRRGWVEDGGDQLRATPNPLDREAGRGGGLGTEGALGEAGRHSIYWTSLPRVRRKAAHCDPNKIPRVWCGPRFSLRGMWTKGTWLGAFRGDTQLGMLLGSVSQIFSPYLNGTDFVLAITLKHINLFVHVSAERRLGVTLAQVRSPRRPSTNFLLISELYPYLS